MHYFVEMLSLRVWTGVVLPAVIRDCIGGGKTVHVCYVDRTLAGLAVARMVSLCLRRVSLSRFGFRLAEIRDDSKLLIRLRISHMDLMEVQDSIARTSAFQKFAEDGRDEGLQSWVRKNLNRGGFSNRQNLSRALFLIQACAWKLRGEPGAGVVLLLERRPWFAAIAEYGRENRVEVVSTPRTLTFRDLTAEKLPPSAFHFLRAIRDSLLHARFGVRSAPKLRPAEGARLGFEYSGYFNLTRPERYSDFSFWQQSSLPGERIVAFFGKPADPVDADRCAELRRHRIQAVALISRATTTSSAPLYVHWPALRRPRRASSNDAEGRWLQGQAESYRSERDYWRDVFRRSGVRVFTTWYRFDSAHCAIAAAVRSLNGIMTVYPRACQPDPSPEIAVNADVAFGYAPADADVELRSGSAIKYHVAVGYSGDHRFPVLRRQAAELRSALEARGARFVVAYFDENSLADPRWHTGHRFQAENYEFLLERFLSDPSMGLVLKPKVPATLSARLGAVWALLERALETGRCYLYREGAIQGTHPPAAAALSADVAIHGHLCAATAGLEAALAGTPTLLLDREGWRAGAMYGLGVGKVVFTSWTELWEAVSTLRVRKTVSGLGDWSPMLDRLDPFRDGRAAERLGTYLAWLIDSLTDGADRDKAMADAAERYAGLWGHDKICEMGRAEAKEIRA